MPIIGRRRDEVLRAKRTRGRTTLLKHFDDACKLYGPLRGPKIMRKFGIKYARSHPSPRAVRMGFAGVRSPEDWNQVVKRFYRKES